MGLDKDIARTLRAELSALLGIRWDSFIEWTVITWLSAWFWIVSFGDVSAGASPPEKFSAKEPFTGPITGVESFIQGIGFNPPRWLTGLLSGLHAADHSWIYWVALLTSVLSCVTAVRSHQHTGLRILALLSAALACEGGLWPVLWIILLAAAPALGKAHAKIVRPHRDWQVDEFGSGNTLRPQLRLRATARHARSALGPVSTSARATGQLG